MSKQELPTVAVDGGACCVPGPDEAECCAPLACEPLSDAGAEDLALLFKAAFDVTAPTVSYHLRILREAGLISSERRGTWVYYRANPAVMARMSAVLVPQGGAPAVAGAALAGARAWLAGPGALHGLGKAPPAERREAIVVVDRPQDAPQRGHVQEQALDAELVEVVEVIVLVAGNSVIRERVPGAGLEVPHVPG
jgi:ArsR family transcriptional regulator